MTSQISRAKALRAFKITAIAGSAAILAACADTGTGGSNVPLIQSSSGAATSVNRYLWTASLETIDFMPLFSVDPVSGVIITDWYANPQVPNERFKANVFILDTALRADALRVSVFRQQLTQAGWADAPVNPSTAAEIENAILSRARELRLNSL
ncbi:DUF3576 domain-containing protein [Parvularcula oceani]|uniref:DUF3576 domain-containing protein n=1 Tax=Parvularcula oceani TaxID=1247963 RepID=UPI0009DF6BA9|nr:DUF3576 domain-containing protein [Parvularcula oceani]